MASNHDEELAHAVMLEMNLDTEPNETGQDEEAEDVEEEPEETLVEGDVDEDEDDPHYYMGHWLVRNNHLFTNAKHNKDSEYWRCIKTDCSSSLRWGREAVLLHLKDFKTYKSRLSELAGLCSQLIQRKLQTLS